MDRCVILTTLVVRDPFLTKEKASELSVEKVDLDTLLKNADIISLHTPLTDDTKNIISSDALNKMKANMDQANIDERTLILKDEAGEEVTYKVADMSEEAKVIYAKLEIVGKDSQSVRANAEFKLEQNDILQKHYVEAIKPLLSSEEEKTEEVEDAKSKKKAN